MISMLAYLLERFRQRTKDFRFITDLSPFCKFPTPHGRNISDLPQITAPTPVYLSPLENFVFAFANAENPTQSSYGWRGIMYAQPIPSPGSDENDETS
ncbi:hypothetical protein H0H93_011466 [Arthromyces matolae]|nr:hypothetical protein H0H93_011466 [Arthromyces matolae]